MKKLIYLFLFVIGFQIQAQVSLEEALDFQGKTPDGTTIDLFSHLDAGQHVMIYFFSDACSTCHEYAPSMDTIYDLYGQNQEDLYVIGINKDVDNEAMIQFANDYNWEFPYLSGLEGNGYYILYDLYGVGMTPTTVIIKPDRDIPWNIIYPAEVDTLQKYLTMSGVLPTKIKEINKTLAVELFPNPVHEYLHIRSADFLYSIQVYNMLGEEVYREDKPKKNSTLDIASWDKGIYFLKMESDRGLLNRKIVVQ